MALTVRDQRASSTGRRSLTNAPSTWSSGGRWRLLLAIALFVAIAGCTRGVSTNVIEIMNVSESTVVIHMASGREAPRELPPQADTGYLVQRGTCLDDRLIAVDLDGEVVEEIDRPCGGDRWVIGDSGLR